MMQKTFVNLCPLPGHFRTGMRTRIAVVVLGIAFISSMLAACGGTSPTAVKSTPSSTPTHVITPTPRPTFTSTPRPIPTRFPTPKPIPTPQPILAPVPAPTSAPAQAAPAVLDLQPLSMSIVGHLDCNKNGAFVCFARVLSSSSNQSDLHWSAFTNVPGNIAFSPVGGVLAPGQSVLITITVPFTVCTPGLFFFQGPINTHTITWAC